MSKMILMCVMTMLAMLTATQAKEWRGLVPLHSTRADVIRTLGQSSESNNLRSKYHSEKEDVYIVFSTKDFCDADTKKLPPGTVLLIQIRPKTAIRLSDYRIDTKRLKRFAPSSPPNIGYEGYLDDEEGVIYRTYQGKVDTIAYIAAARDRHLCPGYYSKPEEFIQIMVDSFSSPFDEYSDIPYLDEKARLDNFAAYLQQEPEAQGYIIAYAGQRAHAGEAQARAQRAKNYLLRERRIQAKRLVIIDGGHRHNPTVELYLTMPGMSTPTAMPTIDPSVVQIIKVSSTKNKRRRSSRLRSK
jgi:hypothetical protein